MNHKNLQKKVIALLSQRLLPKLQALWVFLVFAALPVFIFSGVGRSPVDEKILTKKEEVAKRVKHRKDWDKYLNPIRVYEQGKESFKDFSNEVLEPIALGIEESYVDSMSLEKEKKALEEKEDF